jgi:hypothetical protein
MWEFFIEEKRKKKGGGVKERQTNQRKNSFNLHLNYIYYYYVDSNINLI